MATTRREKVKQERRKSSAKAWAEKQDRTFEVTSIQLPEGVEFWKAEKEGFYKLDVIPFLTGRGNPNADEGMEHFERTYHVHRGMGLQGFSSYCCSVRCFKKRCYVCDWINREGGNADQELVKRLRPQDRMLMNVVDVTSKESKEKGIQVLDQPFGSSKHPSFGQVLKDKIQSVEEYENFSDLEKGYTLQIKVVEDCLPGGKPFMKVTSIEMITRKYQYDEDMIDKAICLDECPIEKSYEELKKILLQEPDEEEPTDKEEEPEEKEAPPRSRKKLPTADELNLKKGDRVEHAEFGECEIVKVSGDGTSLSLLDEDNERHDAVGPDEVELLEDSELEEEEEAPKKPGKLSSKHKDEETEDDDLPDFGDETEDDDKPAPKPRRK